MLKRADVVSRRTDLRAGLIASAIYNANRKDSRSKILAADDFFPALKPKKKPQTTNDHAAIIRKLAEVFGGTITTSDDRDEAPA